MKTLIALICCLLLVSIFFTTARDTIFLLSNVSCKGYQDQVVATYFGTTCLTLVTSNPYIVNCVVGDGVAREYIYKDGQFMGGEVMNCTKKVVCLYQAVENRCVPNIDQDYWTRSSAKVVIAYMIVIFLLYLYHLLTRSPAAASYIHTLVSAFTSIEKVALQGVKLCNPITGKGGVILKGEKFVTVGSVNRIDQYLEGGPNETVAFEGKIVSVCGNCVRFIDGIKLETIFTSQDKAKNNASYLHILSRDSKYAVVDDSLKHYYSYEDTKKIMADENVYFCFSVADEKLTVRGKEDCKMILHELLKKKDLVRLLMKHFELFNEKLGDKVLSFEGLMRAARHKLMWHDKPDSWGSTYWKKYSSDVIRIYTEIGRGGMIKKKELSPPSEAYVRAINDYKQGLFNDNEQAEITEEAGKFKAKLKVQILNKEPEPVNVPSTKVLYGYNVDHILMMRSAGSFCPEPSGLSLDLEKQEEGPQVYRCLNALKKSAMAESYENCVTRESFLKKKSEHDKLQRETLKRLIERGELIFKYRSGLFPKDLEETVRYTKVVKVDGKKVKKEFVKNPRNPGHDVVYFDNNRMITKEYIGLNELKGLRNHLISEKTITKSMNRFAILASNVEGLLDIEGMPKAPIPKSGKDKQSCISETELEIDINLKDHLELRCLKLSGSNRRANMRKYRKVKREKKTKKGMIVDPRNHSYKDIFHKKQEYTVVSRLDRRTLCPHSAAESLKNFKVEFKKEGLVANIESFTLLGEQKRLVEADKYYKGAVSVKDYRFIIAGGLKGLIKEKSKELAKEAKAKGTSGKDSKQDFSKLGMVDLDPKPEAAEIKIAELVDKEFNQSEVVAMYDTLIGLCDKAIAESINV